MATCTSLVLSTVCGIFAAKTAFRLNPETRMNPAFLFFEVAIFWPVHIFKLRI